MCRSRPSGFFGEPCLLLFGTRRLAIAAVGLCIVAIFFGLATGQDLIPGIQGEDRSLPSAEPDAQRSDS
jgi:hypothetical protein